MMTQSYWRIFVALNPESSLLILLLILFTYSVGHVYLPTPSTVHQFESFKDLRNNLLDCNKLEHVNKVVGNFESSQRANLSSNRLIKCPIDEDRLNYFDSYELDTWLNYGHVKMGGKFSPYGCQPKQKVAIIVPYRNRQDHLEKFIYYMHQFLPDQLIDYGLYVAEQIGEDPFNKGKLLNVAIGVVKSPSPDTCCYIFHDVDLMPLSQRNLYMCSKMPRHLSPIISTHRFKLLYPKLFGGVVAMTRDQYDAVGGFSNNFQGWGGEDDDLFNRVISAGLLIERSPKQDGIYIMLQHRKQEPNSLRFDVLNDATSIYNSSKRHLLSELDENSYRIESIEQKQLYTHVKMRLL